MIRLFLSQGGLKAVIWTDVFQCFVMFAGIFSILIKVKCAAVAVIVVVFYLSEV